MKIKLWMLFCLSALCICLLFVSCSGNKTGDDKNTGTQTETETESESESETETDAPVNPVSTGDQLAESDIPALDWEDTIE